MSNTNKVSIDRVFKQSSLFDQCHVSIKFCSINLQIAPGQLVAVVGQVGAGKSSLVQAMLGEIKKHEGNVTLKVNNIMQSVAISNA